MSTSTIDDKDDTKKRRLNEVENACNFNDKKSITNNDSPLVYLNVGGSQRNVRRSILKDLRNASGNPLCDVLLLGPEHWSNVPTIKTDNDSNTIRIYLDRNPMAFDDLLEYIEYGKLFLEEIFIEEKDHQKNGGTRMKRLRLECDYFTVSSFSKDVDEVMYGEPISFRSDSWYSICSTPLDEITRLLAGVGVLKVGIEKLLNVLPRALDIVRLRQLGGTSSSFRFSQPQLQLWHLVRGIIVNNTTSFANLV